MTNEQLNEIFESSKRDDTIFVGSQIRQLVGEIQRLRLTWTKESPAKAGWYWAREIPGRSGIQCSKMIYLLSLVGTAPFLRLESVHDQTGFRSDINLSNMGEWAGPIEAPE